ncbi:hypothetical protein ACGYLO_10870 [Sulfitobacter sp. 1A13353]|uniref:hypothetical protein n=1 Tax=Sulfitobacter sp. 1A13353 TaxID=3368568 RepID=UPI00374753F4
MVSPVLRGISCSDYRATLADLEEDGWSISKTNGGHLKLEHPKASKAIFGPCSPSDYRSRHNVVRKCNIAIGEAAREEKVFGPAPKQKELSDREFTSILKSSKKMRKTNRHKHVPTPSHFLTDAASPADPATPKRKLGTLALPASKQAVKASAEIASSPMQAVAKKLNITSATNQKAPPQKNKSAPTLSNDKDKDTNTMLASVSPTPAPAQPQAPAHTSTPAPQPVSRKPDPRQAGSTAIPSISADVLALAMKITSGEMMQVEVTADMVGQTLYYDGQIVLSGAVTSKPAKSLSVVPSATAAAPAATPAPMPAAASDTSHSSAVATRGLSQNEAITSTILEALKVLGPELVTFKELTHATLPDLPYKSFNSARSSLPLHVNRMIASGMIEEGTKDNQKAYRVKAS